MATLQSLKQALRQKVEQLPHPANSMTRQPLSNSQYAAGFKSFQEGPGWQTYLDFVIPQLAKILVPLIREKGLISLLEIGPGPRSVMGHVSMDIRQNVAGYVAFEPNCDFASILEEWLPPRLPKVDIRNVPFTADDTIHNDQTFDVVLFCHSLYGLKPTRQYIGRAIDMTTKTNGLVIVFHRANTGQLEGLVCHQTATFPTGTVAVDDKDDSLSQFAAFVAGFSVSDEEQALWRQVCREQGRRDRNQNQLVFRAPDTMLAFSRQSTTALGELMKTNIQFANNMEKIKNREARASCPAAVVRPTDLEQVQQCVQWAANHRVSLTVVGGSHSGQCLWPNVVAVDMGAFNRIDIVQDGSNKNDNVNRCLVVAESGCKAGDIIRTTMELGCTVPLGARPSVGAGLWLQGGIGHLAREHGLTCDNIVGAVVVLLRSHINGNSDCNASQNTIGQVVCVGIVPPECSPAGAVRLSKTDEDDLLWAIKGAGTNFGIVICVAFRAVHPAPQKHVLHNWVVPLDADSNVESGFQKLYSSDLWNTLPNDSSVDGFLFWEDNGLRLGVTLYQSLYDPEDESRDKLEVRSRLGGIMGQNATSCKTTDAVGLFDAEMYMSQTMHGGHSGGKTSAFKRCVFLKNIGDDKVLQNLLAAMTVSRPSPLCYFHLLHGGGAVCHNVDEHATAFGCRDWDFACVVTAVWPRGQDHTALAYSAIQWVYDVVQSLMQLPPSMMRGVYGADLGPDPRDAPLAALAFGGNRPRLGRLKAHWDPYNVLAYACPLPKEKTTTTKLIVLVTGRSGAGKDHCANVWANEAMSSRCLEASVMSISEATKRAYAAATQADLDRLLSDRAYKELHRPALTEFTREQVHKRPDLYKEHFLQVVDSAQDRADVLFITGMRDEAPVATFSHLVPGIRMIEVRVKAETKTRQHRRGAVADDEDNSPGETDDTDASTLVFQNDKSGNDASLNFAHQVLLPLVHPNLQDLAAMVPCIADFPRREIAFRHVLHIAQHPGGLSLCTDLLQSHYASRSSWTSVDAIVSCEAGGFVFATALAARVNIPLVLMRASGKLPPPTVSAVKASSHVSKNKATENDTIEMGRDALAQGSSVVIVDDVLASGNTLSAMLRLLLKVGLDIANIHVMVVAEFPAHRARQFLRQRGFGPVSIQSLLVFDGV